MALLTPIWLSSSTRASFSQPCIFQPPPPSHHFSAILGAAAHKITVTMVRLITHNLLACHAKGCTSNNFPLKLKDVTIELHEADEDDSLYSVRG